MNRKIMIIVILSILGIFFVSCGPKEDIAKPKDEYLITWKNYDGEILKINENVKEGTFPTYDGVTPIKESSEDIIYIFNGWSPTIDVVKEDIIYTATFTGDYIEKEYTVTWKNYNGEVLKIAENLKEGTLPIYEGNTPTKEPKEDVTYIFKGWSPTIDLVKKDITYIATFTENKIQKEYTITWKNYNGEILKIAENIKEGTLPTYYGVTPTKEKTEDVSYVFNGWTPTIRIVKGDTTYTATFTEKYQEEGIIGIDPVISQDNKTVQYGFYPQSHVNDESLISELKNLTPSETNGWFFYKGTYYTKEVAKVYNNENYTFNNGIQIINGNEYWFKCEPITWEILSNNDGTYFLLSSLLLDNQAFYQDFSDRTINGETIYANNYQESDLRIWLNNYFYNTAFNLNATYITETVVVNEPSTTNSTNNQYASKNTTDKVYLPSYQDYLNQDYGFEKDSNNLSVTREAKTTDYARATGAWSNNRDNALKHNSSYWTRSASSEYYYTAWNVNSGGYLSEYAVSDESHSVRPCISIRLPK